ncbi:MAG TPA: hypothetical protein DGG95_16585 [Cytophagales bacterium]|nr:hypothetical protein [Cytophagales bacterium]
MKTKNKTKYEEVDRLEFFENFKKYGLEDNNPPLDLIKTGTEFIREKLTDKKYQLQLDTADLDFLAIEMSGIALTIQAFALNCLKIELRERAPINILQAHPDIKFKEAKFYKFNSQIEIKTEDDKYSEIVNKLYHLNEIDPTLVKNISINIETTKSLRVEMEQLDLQEDINILLSKEKKGELSKEDKIELKSLQEKLKATPSTEKVNRLSEQFVISPYLHKEIISALTRFFENITGHIENHTYLNARKDWAEKIIYNYSIDAILPYLRKYVYPTNQNYDDLKYQRQESPKNEELHFIALVLVTASILPTEEEYPKSTFVRENGVRYINPEDQDTFFKKDKTKKKRDRDYSARMIDILKESYQQITKGNKETKQKERERKAEQEEKDEQAKRERKQALKNGQPPNSPTKLKQPKQKEEYPYYQGYSGYYNINEIVSLNSQEIQRTLP